MFALGFMADVLAIAVAVPQLLVTILSTHNCFSGYSKCDGNATMAEIFSAVFLVGVKRGLDKRLEFEVDMIAGCVETEAWSDLELRERICRSDEG
ncbi:unnamed protein product [Cercospora beticola]|nr:unnamed protein product [Cercospora beticola]